MQCLPGLLQPEPLSPRQATADPCLLRRRSEAGLAQSLWGLWVLVHTRFFVWDLQTPLASMGFDSKCDFTPPTPCWGFSFARGWEISFFGGIQHFPVDGCSAVSRNFEFSQEKRSARPSTASSSYMLQLKSPTCWRRKQTEQALSWKQDSILGQTVDFELHARYLWKRHTNWKTRPPSPMEEPQGLYLDSPSPKRIP